MAWEKEGYTTVEDALRKVKRCLRAEVKTETVATKESFGRIAARDLFSPSDMPPFDISHMDGFAVIASDLKTATKTRPTVLKMAGESKLGAKPGPSARHRQAIHVFTGSPVPPGADAVIPLERAEVREGVISVAYPPDRGSFVYAKGNDLRKGERVVKKGQTIRAQDVGALLSLGLKKVRVRRRLLASVIATGSELTDEVEPAQEKVVNSHGPYFLSLLHALGCVPVDMGVAKDDPAEIRGALRTALARSDFVLTLGGTSVGRADLVGEAVRSLGPAVFVQGIKMDRGRVAGIAVIEGKPVLMMPGPIQGAMNAFVLLGARVIGWLQGGGKIGVEVSCPLEGQWEARKRFSHFRKVLYVKLVPGDRTSARPLAGDTESIKVLCEADGYVVVPEEVAHLAEGSVVRVNLFPGFSF
ncbi:MAG: molybdopterin molybdotransferase MoeA [Nitrososphaerota archaeon]|nr:molybdopterin molybdotransferase MoeA [Nitrososphaerota archaeon]